MDRGRVQNRIRQGKSRLSAATSARGPMSSTCSTGSGHCAARRTGQQRSRMFLSPRPTNSARAIDSILGICLHGTAYCTTGVGRRWIDGGRPGTVLSILTSVRLERPPFTVPSAMAKAGIEAMTKSLAVEWGAQRHPVGCSRARILPHRRGRLAPDAHRAAATTVSRACRYALSGPSTSPISARS